MLRVFQIPLLEPWSAKHSRGEESTEITKLTITGSRIHLNTLHGSVGVS